MNPELLVVADLPPPDIMAALEERYVLHRLWEADDPQALLAKVAPSVRGIVTTGADGASAALIKALPHAEIIAIYGVGFDAVDLDAAKAAGIRVTNTPGVLTDDVADLAIGLTLALLRRICAADRFVRDGKWKEGGFPLTTKLTGKRVGILGLGQIGGALPQRLAGFEVKLAYHSVTEKDVPHTYFDDVVALGRFSDVLIVTAAGGPSTRGLVNRAVLDAIGPEGILVNVARGSVVDQDALVQALVDKRLGGAALDVFADEPRVPIELVNMDNVVLTPHMASGTVETRRAMGTLVIRNLDAHFAGRPLLTPVV